MIRVRRSSVKVWGYHSYLNPLKKGYAQLKLSQFLIICSDQSVDFLNQQGFIMRVICSLFMQIGLSDFRYELWCPCFRFDLVPVNPCLTLPFLAFPYLTLRYVIPYLALPGLALPFLTTITAMMITDRVYQFFKC